MCGGVSHSVLTSSWASLSPAQPKPAKTLGLLGGTRGAGASRSRCLSVTATGMRWGWNVGAV